jgi:2-desacetyl-2-hydroxyethyl bacteriochlorophyllide A dehydrogenase
MKNTYRAIIWKGNGSLEIIEKPILKPGNGEVMVKVKAAGICGTDLHILSGKHPQAKPPLILGHEFAGIVVDVGENVERSLIGARVGVDSYIGCNECMFCRSLKMQLCEKGTTELGINIDGGWSEYVTVPKRNIYMVPKNISFIEVGAGCILNCPLAAIEAVGINPGDTVIIIGDGPSSLVMLQLARLKGAKQVIVTGHREKRLKLALELGADYAINTDVINISDFIGTIPKENRPQIVIDAVGKSETFNFALSLAGKCGKVHLFGLPEQPLSNIKMDAMLWKELKITSSTGRPDLWDMSMDLLSRGFLKISSLISHRFPFEEAPKAIEFIKNNPGEIVKAIFEMKD